MARLAELWHGRAALAGRGHEAELTDFAQNLFEA